MYKYLKIRAKYERGLGCCDIPALQPVRAWLVYSSLLANRFGCIVKAAQNSFWVLNYNTETKAKHGY